MKLELKPGDLQRIVKLTKLRKKNGGGGYSYSHVKQCLGDYAEHHNAEIEAIAKEVVAAREKSEAGLEKMLGVKAPTRARR